MISYYTLSKAFRIPTEWQANTGVRSLPPLQSLALRGCRLQLVHALKTATPIS